MKIKSTAWRTDEPCPTCGNDLTMVDDGGSVLRAECRLCGHAEPWETDPDADGDW